MPRLTFDLLRDAIAGNAVALRSRMSLQPAGGEGDKVFPPSYAVDGRSDHKYAVEERQVGEGDKTTVTVLLDSVASQANRAELALLEGWERGELTFPVPYVDFSEDGGATDYDQLTVLELLIDWQTRSSEKLVEWHAFRLSDSDKHYQCNAAHAPTYSATLQPLCCSACGIPPVRRAA